MLFRRNTTARRNRRHADLTAAVRTPVETLEKRLLMDGEFGSLVTRGVGGDDIAHAAAYDRDGNGIVAGSFQNTVDFAPGGVNVFLDAANGSGYVAKYDNAGSMIWVNQVGGGVRDVAVDKHGNVFVTGSFNGTKDFDSSADTRNLTSNGFEDIFVAKYDASGDLLWARQIGGEFSDFGNGIGVDNLGYVYVGGNFAGTVDFNPTGGVASRTAQNLSDGFVLRLTAAGGYNRVSVLAGNGNEYINDIAVDDAGKVFATGRFDKTADFDPAAGSSTLMFADATLGGNYDGFVWKLNANGSLAFARRFGGGLWDEGNAIAIDVVGNAYVTGKFTYEAWFNAGSGGTLDAFGNSGSDAFVASYNSEGDFRWTKRIGGGEHDEAGMDIAVDGGRNVYVTGYFRGIATLNPNGLYLAASKGGTDAFMTALDSNGNFHHAVSYGGTGNDYGRGIAVDNIRGDIWIGGSFQSTVDFDPKAGVTNATSAGGADMYLLRLKRTASPLEWAFAIGLGVSTDEGHFVDVDQDGNVIVAGLIRGVADLDPSADVDGYGPIGSGAEVFVAKFAPDGTHLWSRVARNRTNPNWEIGDEKIGGMTVDKDGDIIVVGTFQTSNTVLDFPNTSQDLVSEDGKNAFIWKLRQNGGHIFARSFGDENTETADGVAVDDSGNIYVTGTFDYAVKWGPGEDDVIESFNYAIDHSSSQDVWVAKYSPTGQIQWARVSGSEGDDTPADIAVNSELGYVYVVGTFDGDDFRANHMANFGANVLKTGAVDSFITRYSTSTGSATQVLRLGGNGETRATAVDVDNDGNVFIGGDFTMTTDFNPHGGVQNRTSAGGTDAFLVKLDDFSAYLFSSKVGAAGTDTVTDLDVGPDGNVYVTGTYQNNVDFNASNILNAVLNGGSGSSFVLQVNNNGGFRSAHKFGNGARSIAIDGYGSAHVVGSFTSPFGTDFDPGINTTFNMTASSQDVLVMKFKPGTTPSYPGLGVVGRFQNGGLATLPLPAQSAIAGLLDRLRR